jgi:putative restriction endonuclease
MAYVAQLETRGDGYVRSRELNEFRFEGRQAPLLAHMKGIRVFAESDAAITIRTTFRLRPEDRPYQDELGADNYLRYNRMRGNPNSRENAALRIAMAQRKPLIWFYGVGSAVFLALYPTMLVHEERDKEQFVVALSDDLRSPWDQDFIHPVDEVLQREYAQSLVKRRLHQPMFRYRVLTAYAGQCALCRLRHTPLLDAAHIKEDSDGGEPIVPNGVAMCAIHHRAFDNAVLGIRPDYVIEIRQDVLGEIDGPTLQHALQGLHASKLVLPRSRPAWPRQDLLEERYERFRAAS